MIKLEKILNRKSASAKTMLPILPILHNLHEPIYDIIKKCAATSYNKDLQSTG